MDAATQKTLCEGLFLPPDETVMGVRIASAEEIHEAERAAAGRRAEQRHAHGEAALAMASEADAAFGALRAAVDTELLERGSDAPTRARVLSRRGSLTPPPSAPHPICPTPHRPPTCAMAHFPPPPFPYSRITGLYILHFCRLLAERGRLQSLVGEMGAALKAANAGVAEARLERALREGELATASIDAERAEV